MAAAKGKFSRGFMAVILVLVMIGLIGFGSSGLTGTVRSIGQVGETKIDINRYANSLQQELRAYEAQAGQSVSLAQARAFGVDQIVLKRLISAAALENETTRLGLSIGDEEVRRQVVETPAFQGLDGKFDREAYEYVLDRSGNSIAQFETSVRADVSSNILQAAIGNGIKAPALFTNTLVEFIGQRRNFSWIELDTNALEEPLGEPTDTDLQTYYDANLDDFMLPESKALTYVWLSPDDVIDQVDVDNDAIRALYDERADEYNIPERRLVERLVFSNKEEAQTAIDAVTSGASTFEDAVAARGLALTDIDLGDVTKSALGGDAGEAVFALPQPGIVGPVDTDLGPAIFRINAVLAERHTSFEDAATILRAELASDGARRLIGDQIVELDDLLAGGATLEELGDETDLTLAVLDWTVESEADIAAYADFKAAAQSVTADDFPEIVELADGGIFALRLNEITAPHPEEFDTAVVKVIEGWQASETASRLTQQAATLLAQLENGARIGSLGQITTVETNALRSSFIEGTAATFISEVFEMDAGTSKVIESGTSVLIAQVTEILPADPTDPDAQKARTTLDLQTAQGISQDLLAAFTSAMEVQGGIELNQTAINSVHAQFP